MKIFFTQITKFFKRIGSFVFGRSGDKSEGSLDRAREKIQKNKRENLNRIMQLFETNEKIVNKDVQELLKVSDTSATRYLDILEEEEKIKQVGETGKGVYYIMK
jgi:predicted HTH transcriptional regulator